MKILAIFVILQIPAYFFWFKAGEYNQRHKMQLDRLRRRREALTFSDNADKANDLGHWPLLENDDVWHDIAEGKR